MTKIKIVTDSTSDISRETAERLGITIVPLNITFENETFRDKIDLTSTEFIKKMNQSPELPKSSQPSIGDFEKVFLELKENDSELLGIFISDKLSGTSQSARMAAEMAEVKLTVFSSDQVTLALQILVVEAADMASRGCTIDEIMARLTEIRSKVKILIAVDTMDNLLKGGRVSKTTAVIGSFLNIKPIITMADGSLLPIDKVRSAGQVIKYFIKNFQNDTQGKDLKYVSVANVANLETAEKIVEEIHKIYPDRKVEIVDASSVLATHVGVGALEISYLAE